MVVEYEQVRRLSYMTMIVNYCLLLLVMQIFSAYSDIERKFAVFGYLPEYRLNANFDYSGVFSMGLSHLLFFSLEVITLYILISSLKVLSSPKQINSTGLPSALDRLPSRSDVLIAREAADNYGAKIMISFGGYGRSGGFSNMVQTKKKRKRFLNQLNNLMLEYRFDGVDYNWEYPQNAKEWSNWGLLMKESKDLLTSGR